MNCFSIKENTFFDTKFEFETANSFLSLFDLSLITY